MKVLSRVLRAIVIGYILVSMALSLLVSFGVLRWEIILHRAPFLLIDVGFSVVEGADAPDSKYGYDQHGECVGFGAEVPEGSKVLTLMVYHPLNNYCDDIVQRFDIRIR